MDSNQIRQEWTIAFVWISPFVHLVFTPAQFNVNKYNRNDTVQDKFGWNGLDFLMQTFKHQPFTTELTFLFISINVSWKYRKYLKHIRICSCFLGLFGDATGAPGTPRLKPRCFNKSVCGIRDWSINFLRSIAMFDVVDSVSASTRVTWHEGR